MYHISDNHVSGFNSIEQNIFCFIFYLLFFLHIFIGSHKRGINYIILNIKKHDMKQEEVN